jgi:hypothetical protein
MDPVLESVGRPSRSLRPALSHGRSSCSPVTRLVRAWVLSLGMGPQSESSRAHGRGPRLPSRKPSSCTLQLTLIPQRQAEPAAHLGPVDSSSRPWDSAGKTSPGPERDHRSRRVGLHVSAYILSPKGFGGIAPSCSSPPVHPPFGAHTGFSLSSSSHVVQSLHSFKSLVPHHILLFLDSALHFHFAQIFQFRLEHFSCSYILGYYLSVSRQ